LPKFVHRKYASLVNIDVRTLLQIAQQKTAKTMKKIFKKKFISDDMKPKPQVFFFTPSEPINPVKAIGSTLLLQETVT
jgi:cytoskeletal protein RodZ